jgi:MFS family permease
VAAREIEECLRTSNREGLAAQITGGVVDYYVVPLAVFLGAGSGMIGWVVAAPSLLAAVAQFFVVDVLRAVANRRRLLVIGAILQGLLLAPVAVLPLLAPGGRIWALLAALAAFRVVGGFMGPVWGSLMSEYLPANERGRYFGDRSRLLGLCGILMLVVFGLGLRGVSSGRGLAVVFAVGAACRLLSVRWMRRMIDLPEPRAEQLVTRLDVALFLRLLRGSNFVGFTAYVAAVTFATQLASTFFAVHMLRDLRFGYLAYSAVRMAASLGGFLAFPLWGRHADHAGNARVLKLVGWLVALVPLPWILFESVWPLFVAEIFSGAVWAGFNLSSANFVYDAVGPERRVRALGYFNVATGLAIFFGAALGGGLAEILPPLRGSSMHTLFLLSAALRLAADRLLSPRFSEVRPDAVATSNTDSSSASSACVLFWAGTRGSDGAPRRKRRDRPLVGRADLC